MEIPKEKEPGCLKSSYGVEIWSQACLTLVYITHIDIKCAHTHCKMETIFSKKISPESMVPATAAALWSLCDPVSYFPACLLHAWPPSSGYPHGHRKGCCTITIQKEQKRIKNVSKTASLYLVSNTWSVIMPATALLPDSHVTLIRGLWQYPRFRDEETEA